ncbi:indole-3-acetaldehyde oxidase-like [Lucilia sericata]|uniref:indole-3-acetaldehyde oxidase-like n=1 Tax=Lucilia sericata TaxID=13632 RepID=UPI0018A7FECE|nr:indole-3-acetaldehyde oxidase-like [Lucilia sericata]
MITKFSINGKPYSVNLESLPADITLNTFIRDYAGLPGTKFMCQEGGCGVCICVATGKHPVTGEIKTWAVNSCLTLLNTCLDLEITTCEGIGNKRDGFHPIQKRLAKMNGTQCGYCSPGFVMNMYGLLKSKNSKVTMEEVENSFGGNICRCTGYRPILDAMKSFAVDSNIEIPEECQDIEDLSNKTCPKTGKNCSGNCKEQRKQYISLSYDSGEQWFWPNSLDEIFKIFSELKGKEYSLVSGNTAHGVFRRSSSIRTFIDINSIPELHGYKLTTNSLRLGGNLSLTETMEIFEKAAMSKGFEYCKKLWKHFDLIANVPVRNMGTLAGNLSMKHQHPEFPSDVYLVFEALDVHVVVQESFKQESILSLSEYLKTPMTNKIIKCFDLKPYSSEEYIFDSYKIMPRAQNAHAYVNAAILIQASKPNYIVKSTRICYGGINPRFSRALQLETHLLNKPLFELSTIKEALTLMQTELKADIVLPEPSPEYRVKLAQGLFYKFLLAYAPSNKLDSKFISGGNILNRPVSSGRQIFEKNEHDYPVKKPTEKHEGLLQCSGEAIFANDLPPQSQQLWAAFFSAKKVGATVIDIDSTEAMKLPGVVAVFTAKDVPGKNLISVPDNFFFVEEEELFLTGEVKFYNQPVGIVVAESNTLAYKAAELIKIKYEGGAKEVLSTLKEVLNDGPSNRIQHSIKSDATEDAMKINNYDLEVKGELEMGLQYHFFMEPHSTVAIPSEGGIQLYVATQWMDLVQIVVSNLLNLRNNEVQVITRRLGGGYGGKATRCNPVACSAALAAYKLNRPVRFVQSIESMMDTLGKRWPCNVDYNFYVKKSGKFVKLISKFYEDAGYSPNESPMGHTLLVSKNCYDFTSDNFILDGYMVLTDSPNNTACRAPGSVEGIAMIENIIEHVAFELGLDPLEVRLTNLITGHKMASMIPRFIDSTQYKTRRQEIIEFNKQNRWIKRGLGLATMEYHIGYFGQFPATVAIYHGDGTVVITHGGIEMGQGMNTKIAQVASHTLDIPLELIRIEGSNSINGANSMVTGGSIGSETVCFAVRKCCNVLNELLKPIKEELKDPTWKSIINEAHNRNLNLIASDGCKTGEMDPYTVCSLGLTEIELDVLTGNYLVKRVDILQDAGESLNPNVDVGQVEGAFVMGLGYWTTELCVRDKTTGELKTNRTWNYKPPGAKDIPIDFRIELLAQSPNPAGFMRSKATGEPSICLPVNVAFALQQAMQSARDDAGLPKKWITLRAPMTPDYILLNCGTDVDMMTLANNI